MSQTGSDKENNIFENAKFRIRTEPTVFLFDPKMTNITQLPITPNVPKFILILGPYKFIAYQ